MAAISRSDDPVRPYRLSASALISTMHCDYGQHRETMPAMMERYGIKGRKVLSVGPGDCAQEYWFHELGNELFLVDIDEYGALEQRIRDASANSSSATDTVTFIVGDARHVSQWLNTKFDVIFTSGFTPDEAHRAGTHAAFNSVITSDPSLIAVGNWPPNAPPCSSLCAEIIERGLADGGLYIMLSYASGPDIVSARNYLPCLAEQFEKLGLALIETHCLMHAPGVHLVVGMKSRDAAAIAAMTERVRTLPPFSTIHARAHFPPVAVRVTGRMLDVDARHRQAFEDMELGAAAPLVRKHMVPALSRLAPRARTAFYAGENPATEGKFLVAAGMSVDLGWGNGLAPPPLVLERQLLHPTLAKQIPEVQNGGVDLCFLSMLGGDERVRMAASSEPGNAELPLFDAQTLPFAAASLSAEGVLIYIGRTNGLDLTYYRDYVDRIAVALTEAGLVLRECYVMRELPGLFLFSAVPQRSASARTQIPGADQDMRFHHLVPDQPTVRIYPRAAAT